MESNYGEWKGVESYSSCCMSRSSISSSLSILAFVVVVFVWEEDSNLQPKTTFCICYHLKTTCNLKIERVDEERAEYV